MYCLNFLEIESNFYKFKTFGKHLFIAGLLFKLRFKVQAYEGMHVAHHLLHCFVWSSIRFKIKIIAQSAVAASM